ncbi:hypothetical protein ABZ725_27670 [Streptomyces sp. NPDC006872]|uniref:hypothetical protein n=1 Tax=Streptomyces sp. NPDC006872 TaxID=3155720 RepID=UPI0033FF1F5C
MGIVGPSRGAVWAAVGVAGVGSAGLVSLAVLGDLNAAGQVASVVGAVVGLAGVVISVLALNSASDDVGRSQRLVRAERGGVAAGGDLIGNAIGHGAVVSGPRTPRRRPAGQPGRGEVRAGPDSVAAVGDIVDNAFGDDSRR